MAAASRLFKDPFWLEEFTTKADTLKAFDLNIDAISACILFHCDLEGKMKNYDEPDKIKHLYSNLLSEMCIKQGVGAEQLNGIIHRIRSLGHTFCHGSTVSLASYSYRETTKVSLSVIPAPCFENVGGSTKNVMNSKYKTNSLIYSFRKKNCFGWNVN